MNPFKTISGRKRPEDPPAEETPSSGMMFSLMRQQVQGGQHIYAGTVTPKTIKNRRAQNKQAKLSRRVNRGR